MFIVPLAAKTQIFATFARCLDDRESQAGQMVKWGKKPEIKRRVGTYGKDEEAGMNRSKDPASGASKKKGA